MANKRDTTRKIKLTLLCVWAVACVVATYLTYSYSTENIGYQPTQPVRFSHKTHAGTFGIKCLYCHTSAETGDFASPPAVKNCMVCHVGLQTKKDLLQPLLDAYEQNRSVKWHRVNELPDYVHFSHSAHVLAQIDCSSCHGSVETFDTVYQAKLLTMSQCIACHRAPDGTIIAPREISGIQTLTAPDPHAKDSALLGLPHSRKFKKGSEECSSCHY